MERLFNNTTGVSCNCRRFSECVYADINIKDLDHTELIKYYAHANKVIRNSGQFNFEFCKFPVPCKWDLELFHDLLVQSSYHDLEVVNLLRYGWPIDASHAPAMSGKAPNQRGARDNPKAVQDWVQSELSNKAVIGPLVGTPFGTEIKISPIDAIPKKDSDEKRVILNLSHPDSGDSVNEAVSKDWYLGIKVDLVYPSVDDLVNLILEAGVGCALMKIDLKGYYRQIYYDPGSIHLVGFAINDEVYCDITLSMGLRIACYIAQRVSDAIIHIFNSSGSDRAGINYIDDLAAVAKWSVAFQSFEDLVGLLAKLRVTEATHKRCPPNVNMPFLGVGVDTINLVLYLTEDRLADLRAETCKWLNKSCVSKRDVQQLVGKLSFASSMVRSGRLFFSRILNFLRSLPKHGIRRIPLEAKKDIRWWALFMQEFSGVSIIPEPTWGRPDALISSDAALVGLGGFCEGEYFHSPIPAHLKNDPGVFINELECMAVVIALKVWAPRLAGCRIVMNCDNQTTIAVINDGKARNQFTQACLREVAYLAATYQFVVKMCYISSEDNRISDWLSRWDSSDEFQAKFWEEMALNYDVTKVKQVLITNKHFEFSHSW